MTGCRIVSLTCGPRQSPPHNSNAPFVLTAACGWTCPVEQGRDWAGSPEQAAWLGHACRTTIGATA